MASSQQHIRAARFEAREAQDHLQVSEGTPLSKDELLAALRHARNVAGQIVQALTAMALEARDRG